MFDLSKRSVSEGPCSSGLLVGAKAACEKERGGISTMTPEKRSPPALLPERKRIGSGTEYS